ncbi:MAG: hypothetical protein NW207_07890 [Cytophagales bacterium]|nr:hypothetical protein [Cytophagales bacterium]
MSKKVKPEKPKNVQPQVQNTVPTVDNTPAKAINPMLLRGILASLIVLYLISQFKNIQYPLFWADESMTMMGVKRVMQFGYPKIHDGKNVFYDLRHSNPKLGMDEKTDAFIGDANWFMYYFGAVSEYFAQSNTDIYFKTGINRTWFAFIGVLGLAFFCISGALLYETTNQKLTYSIVFVALCLLSVPLQIHLREIRYYPLVTFFMGSISYLYVSYMYAKCMRIWIYIPLLLILLFGLYATFSPGYFIIIGAVSMHQLILFVVDVASKKQVIEALKIKLIDNAVLILSFLSILPLISFFRTFEIAKEKESFAQFSSRMYWDNVKNVWSFFANTELGYLLVVTLILAAVFNKSFVQKKVLSAVSYFMILFTLYLYLIAKIPNFIFIRYVVAMIPISLVAILLVIFGLYFGTKNYIRNIALGILLLFGVHYLFKNSKLLSGHITEMMTAYKGPLDEVITYILDKYKKPEELVVATNYEETTFMYYLNCKATIGYVGNNLDEDSKITPDILCYRQTWGNHMQYFNAFIQSTPYERVSFPIMDLPCNNLPEVNFPNPLLNHQFKTQKTDDENRKISIFIRKDTTSKI